MVGIDGEAVSVAGLGQLPLTPHLTHKCSHAPLVLADQRNFFMNVFTDDGN